MKTYLKIITVLVTFFLNMNSFLAQTIQIPISDYSPVVRYYDTYFQDYYYEQPAEFDVGRWDGHEGPDTFEDTYRIYFKFNLSVIPSNVTITNVRLKIKIVGGVCTSCLGTVVFLPDNLSGFAEDRWNAIGTSEIIYFENIPYDGFQELSGQSFTDDITARRAQGYINIGVHGPEVQNLTYGIVETMDLFVDYTVPIQNYKITVKNSFEGGEVKVDGNNYPSGTTFTWEENTQHTLEAFNQHWPASNNYYRVFQNRWEKGGSFYSSNNPIVITITDSATYEAKFLKRFDFEVDNYFVDGGSGGTIKVNGQTQPAPYFTHIIEGESITCEAPFSQTIPVSGNNITYYFADWSNGVTDPSHPSQTFVPPDHTFPDVYYKSIDRTVDPFLGNSKNQRRVLAAPDGNWQEETWNMVYESGGDIWLAWSVDDAQGWDITASNGMDPAHAQRINFNRGQAANPTLSNIFTFSGNPNDHNRYVIAWNERNSSGEMEVHLQTMQLGYPQLWLGYLQRLGPGSEPPGDRCYSCARCPPGSATPPAGG